MNELEIRSAETPAVEPELLGSMIQSMLAPIMDTMTQFMTRSIETFDKLAAAQKVQNDRMEALEKQIRLNTLVTPTQCKYINDALRKRARELLSQFGFEQDSKAVNTLSAAIRKEIVMRYGIGKLNEIPKHEYPVVLQQIATYNDVLTQRDIVRNARKRHEASDRTETQRTARADGDAIPSGTAD